MEVCKDIYETEDLPEVDQDYDDDVKDCVKTLDISVLEAFNKFKGKEVPLKDKNIKRNSEYSNPIDRSRRIIQELEALSISLKKDKESESVDSNDSTSNEQLATLSEALVAQVRELNLEKYFGPESKVEIKDPKNAIYKLLLKKMDSFEIHNPAVSSDDKKHSYSLIRQRSVNEYLTKMKMTNLLKRVERLEKVMGSDSVKLSGIVSDCPSKGLLEAVEKLTSKTSLLNTSQLIIIESRLNGVVNKLQNKAESVTSNTSGLDPESQVKIAELYELVKKYDPVMDSISNVVDQCVSMQDFHIQGAKLSQNLCHLEVKQQEVYCKRKICEMVLKNIEENMPQNFATMENNIKLLEERMVKLQ